MEKLASSIHSDAPMRLIGLAGLSLFLCFFPPSVLADNIQMMPPVDPSTNNAKGCDDKTNSPNRVLVWDGKTDIKCSDKLKIDNDGNVTAETITIAEKATAGASCSPDGKIAQSDAVSGVLLSCQSGKWEKPSSGGSSGIAAGVCTGPSSPVYPAISCVNAGGCYYIGQCAPGWKIGNQGVGGIPCSTIPVCIKD
ncbi:MAG: hypothetical protein WC464_08450 [Bdellovibrionales bacterium]